MNKAIYISSLCFLLLLVGANTASAQFSGNNLAEFQYGQLPNDSASQATLYDRFVANYSLKNMKLSATIEQFHTPLEGSSYINLSQFTVQYKLKNLELKAGNFYETIGRGTLLRSFEIPGAILEDLSYRSRHYFNRDILGATANFSYKNFSTKLIYGKPLNYVFPPTQGFNNRRSDNIAAIYGEYNIKQQTIGLAAMRHWNAGAEKNFVMATASGNISSDFSYYSELAKNISDYKLTDFSDQASYAFYSGLNFSKNSFGLSLEYKSYKNFLIGSGINEPPALVKEHSYKLLNRSTHVLQPLNESGYQLELFYTFDNLSTLTANHTLAINDFARKFVFQEYFLEYSFSAFDNADLKLFVDYAQDPFKLEENRLTTGINSDHTVFKHSSLKFNYEFQTFKRLGENFQNHAFGLGYAFNSKLIVGLVAELSDDSFIVSEGTKFWLGGNIKYQVSKKHNLQMFVGERRGGPACNAGVCYEVLDFKGVEMRLTSRF